SDSVVRTDCKFGSLPVQEVAQALVAADDTFGNSCRSGSEEQVRRIVRRNEGESGSLQLRKVVKSGELACHWIQLESLNSRPALGAFAFPRISTNRNHDLWIRLLQQEFNAPCRQVA